MALKDTIARLLGIEAAKSGNAGPISEAIAVEAYTSGGVDSPVDLRDYATATTNLSWLYRALHLKASNGALIKPIFYEKGTDRIIRSGPAVDLFSRVNTGDNWFNFAYRTFFDLDWAGEFVWELARTGSRVTAMTTISPQRIKPVPSARGIEKLLVDVGGKDDSLNAGDFVYFYRYNPTNRYRGLSVIQSLSNTIGSDWNTQLRILDLVKSGGIPSGILSFPDVLGKNQAKQVRHDWERIHGASNKAGRTAVLSGGANYQRIQLSPQDLQVLEMRKFTRDEIATITGVPPFMLGNESATYSNALEQRNTFWHETMMPTIKGEVFGAINELLMPLVQPNIEVRPDLSAVDKLLETEASRVENATKGFQRGIISRNEAREAMNYEPIAGGDVYLDPLNSRLVNSDGEVVNDPTSMSMLSEEIPSVKNIEFDPDTKDIEDARERKKQVTYGRFINQRNRAMRRLNKVLRKALAKSRNAIVEAVRDWEGGGVPEIPLSEAQGGADLYQDILPAIKSSIGDSADEWSETLDKEKAVKNGTLITVTADDFAVDNPQVRAYLEEHLLNYTKGMTLHQLENLQKTLADNAAELDLYDLSQAIALADISFTEVASRRAINTWSTAAINLGALEAGRRFGTPKKSWISQRIGEPRDWHMALESNKPIPSGEPFQTPYGVLQYPGDASAAAKDLYNCHCVLLNEE